MLAVGAKGLPRASGDRPSGPDSVGWRGVSPPRKLGWTEAGGADGAVPGVSPAQAKMDPAMTSCSSQAKMDPERSHRRSSSSIKFLGLGGRNGGMTPQTLAIPGYTATLASVVRS